MPGFQYCGVFTGSDAYVRHMLGQVASNVCKDEVMHLLCNDIQTAWVISFLLGLYKAGLTIWIPLIWRSHRTNILLSTKAVFMYI